MQVVIFNKIQYHTPFWEGQISLD